MRLSYQGNFDWHKIPGAQRENVVYDGRVAASQIKTDKASMSGNSLHLALSCEAYSCNNDKYLSLHFDT